MKVSIVMGWVGGSLKSGVSGMDFFKAKRVFITGAASGIGRTLAQACAADGCQLMLSDVNMQHLAETQSLCEGATSVSIMQLDVADRQAVEVAAAETVKKLGGIDVVFNNAGVALGADVAEMKYEDFNWLFDINFWGVVYGTQAFLPYMLEQNSGHIVNTSSLFGLIGVGGNSAYCAAKHAVRGYTESLRMELFESDVQVHTVHPGGVATNIAKDARKDSDKYSEDIQKKMMDSFDEFLSLPPERAAEIIMSGVAKGKHRILVGNDAKWIDRFNRWLPNLTNSFLGKDALKRKNKMLAED